MMGVMLQRDTQNQRLYIHDVVLEIKTPDPIHRITCSRSGSNDGNERLYLTTILDNVVDVKKSMEIKRADAEKRAGSNSRGSESSNVPPRDDSNSINPNISNRINIVNQIPDEEEDEKQKKAEHQYTRWIEETEIAKRTYGDFDLGTELQNPQFRKLLRSGVSVGDAYLISHQEDVFMNAARMGVRLAEDKVNRRVEKNRRRPRENGLSPAAPFITRPNVSKMTRADRLAIARRVAKDERIVF